MPARPSLQIYGTSAMGPALIARSEVTGRCRLHQDCHQRPDGVPSIQRGRAPSGVRLRLPELGRLHSALRHRLHHQAPPPLRYSAAPAEGPRPANTPGTPPSAAQARCGCRAQSMMNSPTRPMSWFRARTATIVLDRTAGSRTSVRCCPTKANVRPREIASGHGVAAMAGF